MSYLCYPQGNNARNNNQDHERQITENGRVDALNQGTTTFVCSALVLVCVFSVLLDPLFFYLPVINESKKCIGLDKKLWTTALVLRSVTDFFHLMHICFRIRTRYKHEEPLSKREKEEEPTKTCKEAWRRFWPYFLFLIDILVILPVPQVGLPIILSEMRSKKRSSNKVKFLNSVLLFQYGPRILQIYLSWKKLIRSAERVDRTLWVKAILNFFLYILAGHVLGAFWYFFSSQRLAACWHIACKNHSGCVHSSFNCDHSFGNLSYKNLSFISDICPINPPNSTTFDFGIFGESLQSGTLESEDFPQKLFFSFWWGMRNLCSFGSNLQTSDYIWENCFSLSIAIFGLLLFIYFLGNLQMYMQRRASKSIKKYEEKKGHKVGGNYEEEKKALEEMIRKCEEEKKALEEMIRKREEEKKALEEMHEEEKKALEEMIRKREEEKKALEETKVVKSSKRRKRQEANIELWLSKEKVPTAMKSRIIEFIHNRFDEDEDVNVENLIPDLPLKLQSDVKRHICLNLLKNLNVIKKNDLTKHQQLLLNICNSLKPMFYNEQSYIVKEGDPIDAVFLITYGIAWTYPSSNNGEGKHVECLEKGHFFGEELLELLWNPSSVNVFNLSKLPVSSKTLKTHTKVEVFALMANDLKDIVVASTQGILLHDQNPVELDVVVESKEASI
ncbi:cyclic nucleotide-gated ion channel 1-like [Quercus lobata]|uniref:cyclic nucleotide-gated ion channel 1-like n=1 Tax=Quercus lobata TaxID=97700 RepID=UPI001249292F|nr:cyclic nucleotide-gated ion channel 1-like [Quercus lobata]XP_030944780.1 cyclic nucleotide-gated ion channel 1-like [Quercus lobata]